MIFEGWQNRSQASDIIAEKGSDAMRGVERVYDKWIAGKPGVEQTVVNVNGDPVDALPGDPPQRGWDAILTLDATVVLYDPDRDIAVLAVPDLEAKPLAFAGPARTGDSAIVIGYRFALFFITLYGT